MNIYIHSALPRNRQEPNAALQSRAPAPDKTPAPRHAGDFPFPNRCFQIFRNSLKPHFDRCLYLQTLPCDSCRVEGSCARIVGIPEDRRRDLLPAQRTKP